VNLIVQTSSSSSSTKDSSDSSSAPWTDLLQLGRIGAWADGGLRLQRHGARRHDSELAERAPDQDMAGKGHAVQL
jgi:hypothetical protein